MSLLGLQRLPQYVNFLDKEKNIQPYEQTQLKMEDCQPYEHPRLSSDDGIPEVHESGWLSTSFTLME